MPTLLETERAIAAALRSDHCGAAAEMIAAGGVSANEALAIYRNTFVSGAVKALRLSYPAVERLTGAEFFASAAAGFVAAAPPSSGCLDDYGAEFAGYLAQLETLRDLPWIADVARLDWAVNLALHADDAVALDAAGFAGAAGIAPERLVLVPHVSLSLLRLDYPADAVWRAVLADDDSALAALDVHGGLFFLLVWRNADTVQVSRVSQAGFAFLSALCAGRTFAESFDVCPAPDLPQLLAESLAAGRFAGFQEIS
ncbi:MAG TPA: DNA-binding domain-containing protein, partial [Micropepsaceae bacterium]|nr:DNA-binding domain-containing protein [Micropepsaceae bacterium]